MCRLVFREFDVNLLEAIRIIVLSLNSYSIVCKGMLVIACHAY